MLAFRSETSRLTLLTALIAMIFASVHSARAQDGTGDTSNSIKSEATLTAPDGATNTNAKGTAKTFYVDNGQTVMQRLQITAQQLDRGVDYDVMVDGVDYGLYSPRGGSGTLVLRFRDPARGGQLGFPEDVVVDV